jgi:hypothetical protein
VATIFIPPAVPRVPAAVDPGHPSYALFRFYRPWDAGINVWRLRDGSITTNEPADASNVLRIFHGGHVHEVDADEAVALIAAGFTVVAT